MWIELLKREILNNDIFGERIPAEARELSGFFPVHDFVWVDGLLGI